MTTKRYIMGIDSSTTSTKAIVWDLQGRAVSMGRASIPYEQPVAGWAEQDAAWWSESMVEAVQEALDGIDPAHILAAGLTWQRETWVPLGQDGQPLRHAILWMDSRGDRELEDLRSDFGERFCEVTGKPLDVTPSIIKILWLRRHEPEVFARVARILDVGSYLTRELTGELRTCSAGADTMGLVDMRRRAWSSEFVLYAGLTLDQLPDLVEPGELLGTISPQGADATGLLMGTPLIAGGGDGQCSAIGNNVLEPGAYGMSLGTSLSMNVHIKDYVADRAFRTLIGCVPDSYLAEVNTRACTLLVQWFVREFGREEQDLGKQEGMGVEDVLDRRLEQVPPGADGLLTLPYWRGAMMPHNMPLIRGATLGWSDYHTKAHFYRSLLEGLAFEFRLKLEAIECALNQPCDLIHVSGGGAQSREWCQIISDVTRKRLIVSASPESTCLGAAMLAATTVGAFENLQGAARAMTSTKGAIFAQRENVQLYDELYKRVYLHLLPSLQHPLTELRRLASQH